MDETKTGATKASVDADGFTWVYAPPISIDAKEFSAFIPRQGRGNQRDFMPFATLRFDCLHYLGNQIDTMVIGLDKIMNLLNCCFPDDPFHGHEESIADMMEYGSEPWIYHLRDLLMEAHAEMLLFKLEFIQGQSPDGYLFNGYIVRDVYTILRQG